MPPMSLKNYLQRLQFIDSLISKKATGSQKVLAEKMRLSRSGLNKLLNEMKEAGFPIRYDHQKQSYYYENSGRMVPTLFQEELSREEMKKALGGISVSRQPHAAFIMNEL